MVKYFISATLLVNISFATLIGGVSMSVDNEPITLYEIKSYARQNNATTSEAVNRLIQNKIEDIEIKKIGIVVSSFDIDKRVNEIATQNSLSLEKFLKMAKSEGHSEKKIRQDIENRLKRETLYKKIVGAKLKQPDDDELKSYYKLHQNEFNMPTKVDLLEYFSKSPQALEMQKKQPMVNMPNISVTPKTIDLKSINPQLAQLLIKTPDSSFTQVLDFGGQSGMFFVKQKSGIEHVPFEMAKQGIFTRIIKDKEQAVLIEYFEKKKSEATIKVVRKPK